MKTRDSLARAAVVAAVALFIFSRPGFAQDQDQPEPQILLEGWARLTVISKATVSAIDCYGVKGQRGAAGRIGKQVGGASPVGGL